MELLILVLLIIIGVAYLIYFTNPQENSLNNTSFTVTNYKEINDKELNELYLQQEELILVELYNNYDNLSIQKGDDIIIKRLLFKKLIYKIKGKYKLTKLGLVIAKAIYYDMYQKILSLQLKVDVENEEDDLFNM